MLEHNIELKPGEDFADPSLVRSNPRVRSLIRRSRVFGFGLFSLMLLIYVGFFALVALAPGLLGIGNFLFGSVGFLLVFLMFVVAWTLTWVYLRHTTHVMDPMVAAVRTEILSSMEAQAGAR